MTKGKGTVLLLVLSALYMIAILGITREGSNMGRSGLKNYLLRGTVFLPVGLISAVILIFLIGYYTSHLHEKELALRLKLSFYMAWLILGVLGTGTIYSAVHTIRSYREDCISGPVKIVLYDASLERKITAGSRYSMGSVGYLLKGRNTEGAISGFRLSEKDILQGGGLGDSSTITVEYYPKSRVVVKLSMQGE